MKRPLSTALCVAGALLVAASGQAATGHQTKTLDDGSQVVFTISTQPDAASGSGADLGDFGPADPESAQTGTLPTPTTDLSTTATDGTPSGSQTMYGTAKYTNPYGVTLFTYAQQISWKYANRVVTSIYAQQAWSRDTCCLWNFHGNTAVNHTAAGQANFTAFAQGSYQACILWACEGKSPWIWLQGNGNGAKTGYQWGGV